MYMCHTYTITHVGDTVVMHKERYCCDPPVGICIHGRCNTVLQVHIQQEKNVHNICTR